MDANPHLLRRGDFVIGASRELAEQKRELEGFLFERVYRHPRLLEVRSQAQERLRTMFDGYLRRPELMPVKFQRRRRQAGLRRSVAEYLAGMTDRFCRQRHAELCGPAAE